MPLVDIVGHFGTRLSYATVGSEIAQALRARGLLGAVSNFDATWDPSYSDLEARAPSDPGSRVILFTPPAHYLDGYAAMYGRDNAAIFVSPNTDRLDPARAAAISQFGVAITPSTWCESVTYAAAAVEDTVVWRLPLGVKPTLLQVPRPPHLQNDLCHFLHFSTDMFWPGRKGTEELLHAWSKIPPSERGWRRLCVHLFPSIYQTALRLARELEIDESVDFHVASGQGDGSESIAAIISEASFVVAPSRAEGFGILLASCIAAGVPLLATAVTGQLDFLNGHGGWFPIPTRGTSELAGECGLAPVVNVDDLALTLRAALAMGPHHPVFSPAAREHRESLTWDAAAEAWVERIEEWIHG